MTSSPLTEPSHLLVERRGDIVKIVLNRPEKLNAVTLKTVRDLTTALRRAADEGARVVMITGAGRAFCSGGALDGGATENESVEERFDHFYNPLALTLADLPIPVVTAVNGPAVGGGASIALAGDIILAARSSYIMLAFSRIGLVPNIGATWLVARAVGRVRALQMALLGERLPAEEALRAGLVTEVVDDDALMERAEAVCARLADMPTRALGLIRRQVRSALGSSLEASLETERDNQVICAASEDMQEGAAAFREKRPPVFKGR